MRRLLAVGLMSGFVLSSSACIFILGAAGVGGYQYARGELARTYPVKMRKASRVSVVALRSLDLKVLDANADGLGGKIEAQRADGMKIWILMRSEETGVTKIGVRVGVFGNKKFAERIHERILKHIK